MTFLAPLLIWIAKLLLQHFLDSNVVLKRQLQEAIDREAELKNALADHEHKQKAYQAAIDVTASKVGELSNLLYDLEQTRKQMEGTYEEKKAKISDNVGSLSDADAVRAKL